MHALKFTYQLMLVGYASPLKGDEVNDCTAALTLLAKTPEAETVVADKESSAIL